MLPDNKLVEGRRYTRGSMLPEQSSIVCAKDFMCKLSPWKQNFHSAMLHDIKHAEYLGACAGGKLNMLPCVYYSVEQAPGTCSGNVLSRVHRP